MVIPRVPRAAAAVAAAAVPSRCVVLLFLLPVLFPPRVLVLRSPLLPDLLSLVSRALSFYRAPGPSHAEAPALFPSPSLSSLLSGALFVRVEAPLVRSFVQGPRYYFLPNPQEHVSSFALYPPPAFSSVRVRDIFFASIDLCVPGPPALSFVLAPPAFSFVLVFPVFSSVSTLVLYLVLTFLLPSLVRARLGPSFVRIPPVFPFVRDLPVPFSVLTPFPSFSFVRALLGLSFVLGPVLAPPAFAFVLARTSECSLFLACPIFFPVLDLPIVFLVPNPPVLSFVLAPLASSFFLHSPVFFFVRGPVLFVVRTLPAFPVVLAPAVVS